MLHMELSIFLGQLLGLYFLVIGIIFLIKRKSLLEIFKGFGTNRGLLIGIASLELLAGLALVIAHPIYTFNWQGLITFLGAWMILESVFFLLAPGKTAKFLMRKFNTPTWYVVGGIISIILGAYLAASGFALI